MPKKTRLTASDMWARVLPMPPAASAWGSAAMVEPGSSLLRTWRAEILAEADAGEQFGLGGEAVFGGDLVVVGLVVLGEAHLVLAGFAVEQLLADLHGAFALMFVDPVLDLVAGAGGLGEAEPVAAGGVAGLGGDLDDVAVAELVRRGTMRPLTLAPMVVFPTSVWMA